MGGLGRREGLMPHWVPVGCSGCCSVEFLHCHWLWDRSSKQDVLLLQTWPYAGGAAGNCLHLLVGRVLLPGPPRVRVSESWARAGRTCPEQGVGWTTRHGVLVLCERWGGLSQAGPGGILGLPEQECCESLPEWDRALVRNRNTPGMVPFPPIAPTADVHGIPMWFMGQHPAWVRGDGCMGQQCPSRSTPYGMHSAKVSMQEHPSGMEAAGLPVCKGQRGMHKPMVLLVHAWGAVLLSPAFVLSCFSVLHAQARAGDGGWGNAV